MCFEGFLSRFADIWIEKMCTGFVGGSESRYGIMSFKSLNKLFLLYLDFLLILGWKKCCLFDLPIIKSWVMEWRGFFKNICYYEVVVKIGRDSKIVYTDHESGKLFSWGRDHSFLFLFFFPNCVLVCFILSFHFSFL